MATDRNAGNTGRFDTGDVIDGKWVLIDRIGEGGMGVVYRAHQLNLKRDVAIKLISEDMLADLQESPQELAMVVQRFQREVQTMAQVRHPNVLQIYDYGSATLEQKGGSRQVEYIAMEYIPGNTFRYTMSEQGFEDETELLADWLRRYFLPVTDGMAAIHAHGIVHRDMKPENILMDEDIPKITDFGLARSLKLRCVTDSCDLKGTWPYMAPEQFADFRKAGSPADIYALGKILYEAAAGKLDQNTPPFRQVALKEPATTLLKALDGVIQKATREDPDQRFQTVTELKNDVLGALEAAAAEAPASIPHSHSWAVRWLWVGIAAAVLSMAGMTVYHVWEGMRTKPSGVSQTGVEPSKGDDSETQKAPEKLSATRLAADGKKMRLVEAPEAGGMFYADTALVTFHDYLEFLNEIAGRISVEEGLVRLEENVVFYLEGKVVFREGRFHLADADRAPLPVTRVTWHGARAYARHYDKRLITHAQWSLLRQQVPEAVEPPRQAPAASENRPSGHMGMMHSPEPETDDALVVSGDAVTREWVRLGENGQAASRVVEWPISGESANLLRRYPWEGFADVGFRTVMNISGDLQH